MCLLSVHISDAWDSDMVTDVTRADLPRAPLQFPTAAVCTRAGSQAYHGVGGLLIIAGSLGRAAYKVDLRGHVPIPSL